MAIGLAAGDVICYSITLPIMDDHYTGPGDVPLLSPPSTVLSPVITIHQGRHGKVRWAMDHSGDCSRGASSILKGSHHPFEWPWSSFSLHVGVVMWFVCPHGKGIQRVEGQIRGHSFFGQSLVLYGIVVPKSYG